MTSERNVASRWAFLGATTNSPAGVGQMLLGGGPAIKTSEEIAKAL